MQGIGHRSQQPMIKLFVKEHTGILVRLPLELQQLWRALPRFGGVLTTTGMGLVLPHLGLALLALATATSSLTFNWVIEHNQQANFFPEFAGRVVYLSDTLLVGGLAFWTLGWRLSPRQPWRYGPWYVFLPLLLLAVLTVLSIVWAGDAGQAGYSALRRSLLLAMYLVLVNDASRALRLVVVALFGIGLLQAGVSLAQVARESAIGLTQLGEITQGALGYGGIGSPRAYGLGFNPNPVGLFLGVVSALAFGLLLLTPGGWRVRALTAVPFIVAFLGMGATGSRAALLGWILGLLAVSLLTWLGGGGTRRTTLKRFGLAVLLVLLAEGYTHLTSPQGIPDQPGMAGLPSPGIESVATRFTPSEVSSGLSGRAADAKLSLPISRDNPFLGVGAGNYPLALKARLSPDPFGPGYVPVHNVPLLLYAELGFAGGVAWVLLMAAPLVWFLSSHSRHRLGFYQLVWLGPLLVLLVASLFDFPPWATQDGRVLMIAVLGLWAGGIVAGNKKA